MAILLVTLNFVGKAGLLIFFFSMINSFCSFVNLASSVDTSVEIVLVRIWVAPVWGFDLVQIWVKVLLSEVAWILGRYDPVGPSWIFCLGVIFLLKNNQPRYLNYATLFLH